VKDREDGGKEPLRVAIIGCGAVGQREASAVSSTPDLRLVAVSDVGPVFRNLALQMGAKYECDTVHDWRHLVAREDIDVVVVSTPNSFHKAMSIEAMKHGKHVLCEKPLATSPEDAEEMVLAAKVNGVQLMTNFNHRAHDHNRRAWEIIHQGLIGRPMFIRGRIGHGRFVVKPSPSAAGRLLAKDIWNTDVRQSGGGTVTDNGVHLLDLARWFMGEEFVEVQGSLTRNLDLPGRHDEEATDAIRPNECEDNGFGLFKTRDGRVASLHSSWVQWQGYLHLEVFGTQGSVVVNNDQIQGQVSYFLFEHYGDPIANTTEVPALLRPDPSWRLQLEALVRAIRERREPSPSGHDGLQAARMVHALYRSAASGKVEAIPTDPGPTEA
jgi:predicted dehydrogenase